MLTPAEAEKLILSRIAQFPAENCVLAEAHGRVLRAEVRADRDLPPFDRVTMDGYALRSSSVETGVRTFQIGGVQAAGMRPFELDPAQDACVEIMTGAMLPIGADCVVPYEVTKREKVTYSVTVKEECVDRLLPGHAVHKRGSDYAAGDLIVPQGTKLSGREIAVAASCGCATLSVSQQPKIAVVGTGDELVEVDAIVAPHQIRRSNDYALRAALIAAGYPRVERFHLHDMRHEIEHQVWHILAEFDVVLLTGGVSKGKFDYLPEVLEALGVKKIFHGVAQKPGKPFWFGMSSRQVAVFALPGNPVSAYTCLHRYVLPALTRATGHTALAPTSIRLAEPISFQAPLAYLLPVQLVDDGRGGQSARPQPTNSSGDFAGLVSTDGFVELPSGPGDFPAGTVANLWRWV
ncbi:MAG: molybdopterin molybdotransferase MoeA [Cephaloticoccus sp.]|nr:molybdopterin molybdotransferase MoeA [Cephaloticoccus sp.]MCF7759192.1 molybdopterin molybdotransferase MoeA [Cephaloticoccus sp.]